MSIKDLLSEIGVDHDEIIKVTKYVGENFRPKEDYNKKIVEITKLNTELAAKEDEITSLKTLETSLSEKETELQNLKADYEQKIIDKEAEYEKLKTSQEKAKVEAVKKDKLLKLLEKSGVEKTVAPLLLKEFDLEKIEVEEESIKDWDNVLKPVKDNFGDLFGDVSNKGVKVESPPKEDPDSEDLFLSGFNSDL